MLLLRWMILTCCCSFILTGCIQKEIVDDINIESIEGFDLMENDEVLGTFLVPIYRADKTISNETFSEVASLNKDLLSNLQKKSSAPLVNGSLEVVLFNKALAEKGILPLMDALQRDASIGTGLRLAVVDGMVQQILVQDLGGQGTGDYILNLLKHNIDRRDVPRTDMHIFLSDFYQEGKDPNLPLLRLTKNKVEIIGAVIFKKEKMTTTVRNDYLFYFKLLVDSYTDGTLSIKVPNKEEYVAVKSIKTKRKLKVHWKDGVPSFEIQLKVDGVVKEYSENKVDDKKIKEFQKLFNEDIKKKTVELIQTFQEQKVDPIGLGYEAKSRKRGFDMKKWEEQYPTVKIDVKTEVRIIGTGITE